ncbi:MAG TPA: PIN domain nuclease [Candidatus Acidoferrum sp.]|jgi:predicted nucleic acid-binding protein|nr:PIN domain nuclease [Candidatus Acidoferrum sp.]
MIIVDSTVWVDYFNGARNEEIRLLEARIGQEEIGLTDLIVCEVLQGLRSEREFDEVRLELLEFSIFPTGGMEMAVETARNYQKLRVKGFTVRKTIDCWIATFCLREGHELLHRDRDFDPFESELGLRVVRA